MQEFKIEHFKKERPDNAFPEYHSLNIKELSDIQNILFSKLNLDNNNDLLPIVEKTRSIATLLDDINAGEDRFGLLALLSTLNIQPDEYVYINWYRYDDVDKIKIVDLDKYFDDIWYQGSDDIDIFDKSFSWILSIRHDGVLAILKIKE